MKKYGILFLALLLCFAFSACGKSSSNENSKEPEGNTIATENEKEHTNKKTLDSAGDNLYDPNTGTVTLNSSKDLRNEKLTIGDLNITFIDTKVITVTNISAPFKAKLEQIFGVQPKEFTYAQIRYKTENIGNDDISWRGFLKAVNEKKQQIDLDFNLDLGLPNPSSIKMMSKSKLDNNMLWVPVHKNETRIRLKAADVLKDDNSKRDFIVYGKEIALNL
ncbi:hypothetical protein [Bacillus amyloliquefaciens]|uniref:Lipoprotein n=1 Tax=Bacillus amyloliquefaciens TaxID=1390 RepID=A0AAP7N8G0_BACAM|nr:hypothetical protein [Bacillus amyloliquefaciens]OIK22126.1 hypothetical protein BKP66_00690 [Bacillus amyloliquefaciens]